MSTIKTNHLGEPAPTSEQLGMVKPDDHRSPIAIARDDYLGSEEGRKSCDPTTLGAPDHHRRFLQNRIEAAFLEGTRAYRATCQSIEAIEKVRAAIESAQGSEQDRLTFRDLAIAAVEALP